MDESTPRLSVVIPAYNVEHYVKEAVDSVVAQSVPAYEIIIVNDGSTDRTGTIVEELYGHLDNVRIIHTPNQGLGMARNVGTAAATGEFIYYFDSDDVLKPGLFEKFRDVYRQHRTIDLFCFSGLSFHDNPSNPMGFDHAQLHRGFEEGFPTGEAALNAMAGRGTFFAMAWLYIHRRSVSQQHNLQFMAIFHEDAEYTPRLFLQCGLTYICNDEYFCRRIRGNSIMTIPKNERHIHGYYCAVQTLTKLMEGRDPESPTYSSLKKLRLRSLVNVTLAFRANPIELNNPELQKFREYVKRHARTDAKLFTMTYLFPIYRAARAAKRALHGLSR